MRSLHKLVATLSQTKCKRQRRTKPISLPKPLHVTCMHTTMIQCELTVRRKEKEKKEKKRKDFASKMFTNHKCIMIK